MAPDAADKAAAPADVADVADDTSYGFFYGSLPLPTLFASSWISH